MEMKSLQLIGLTMFLIDCDHVKYSFSHIKNISWHDTYYMVLA